jgi:hypothetical protein
LKAIQASSLLRYSSGGKTGWFIGDEPDCVEGIERRRKASVMTV